MPEDRAAFFHVAILVPDLDQAMERFGRVLDLDFAEPAVSRVTALERGEPTEWDLKVSYSRQGPPYLELIEATGDGVLGAHNGYGLHHIGAWSDDCATAMDRMATHGIRTQTIFLDGDTNLGGYLEAEDLFGLRFEFSPAQSRAAWRGWVEGTGEFL